MDVNVVIEARKGDREAFGRLMAEIRPALMAQACAILKDEFIADECVSETMMRIFEKLPQLRSAGSFPVWARRICADAPAAANTAVSAAIFPCRACRSFRIRSLSADESSLRRLSAQDAFIVYQKAVENVSFTALGKALSLSPNTVKSRFYRALRQLGKSLTQTGLHRKEKTSKKYHKEKEMIRYNKKYIRQVIAQWLRFW